MALTAAQLATVVKILQVTPSQLDSQFEWLGTGFTSTHQTAVEAELDRWELKGAKFTKIKDYLGADIDPEREKDDIRKNIAILLERPDWARNSSGATSRVQRG
jgi:hypothetical protein